MSMRWDKTPSAEQPPSGAPLDPYYRWALGTQFRGMNAHAGWPGDAPDDEHVQIIACAKNQAALDLILKDTQGAAPLLHIADSYRQPIPGTQQRALHFTATLKKADLALLTKYGAQLRWELSQPRRDAQRLTQSAAMGYYGPSADAMRRPAPNVLGAAIAKAKATPTLPSKLKNVIAVIDFGCPFFHPAFAHAKDRRSTRVAALWEQGSEAAEAPAWPWTTPSSHRYGREIESHVLTAMSQALHTIRPAIEEATAYRGIDYLTDHDDPRGRVWFATHGTHVLDVAGGRVDPLSGQVDAASDAELVFVQLPSLTARDSSGASLGSHVLDGLRYILDKCSDDAKLVVTLSYGSHGGPHNGSSLIEAAMDELLQARKKNFAIVLAAGNSKQKACHALHTLRPQRPALLRCAIAEGDTTDSFVETWYPPLPKGWTVKARARAPNTLWSGWVLPGQDLALRDTAGAKEMVACLRNDNQLPNATGQGLVLLALAPTEQPPALPCDLAEAGLWEIELALHADQTITDQDPSIDVHARLQRDDPGQNANANEHFFVDQVFGDALDTLSSITSGQHTIAVGGFRLSDGKPAHYSAQGPQRDKQAALPLVLAACEEDDVNPHIRAAAVRSGEVYRMNGTSVAAPVLARQLFNTLHAGDVQRSGWRRVLNSLAARKDGVVRWPEA